jgi:hypothetical protein
MSAKKIRTSVLSFLNDAKGSIAGGLESRRQQAEKDFADFYKAAQSSRQELDLATALKIRIRQECQHWHDRAEVSERRLGELQQQLESSERQQRETMNRTRDMFHFTAAASLPEILRQGVTRGCVNVDTTGPYDTQPQAACLTSNGDGWDQKWADGSVLNKRKIRLTVRVPECVLTSSIEVQRHYRINEKVMDAFYPAGQRHHWYYVFSGVMPEAIVKVEVWTGSGYEGISGEELDELVADIGKEIDEKVDFARVESGFLRGARCCGLKQGVSSSWLFDVPAENVFFNGEPVLSGNIEKTGSACFSA